MNAAQTCIIGMAICMAVMITVDHSEGMKRVLRKIRVWIRTPRWQRQYFAQLQAEARKTAEIMRARKAEIIVIGSCRRHYDVDGKLWSVAIDGWEFDNRTAQAIPYCIDPKTGHGRIFGYSYEEISEIHARRKEWETVTTR